ncbi:microcin C ABC transporter permease YejB [Catenovulum adriaticum]|uniref:Microcin C ABC transporter permease YejB n=1 Tax=Catenovulum adriaticum TaxID=2984846 RepID=A0ABY7AMM9_9ALTE|nr:microcin C ABC transporter permease YejB [Catenovulum sp. TS8]WAJ69715.1 microcin C ABC transporter permease YejB [Catenovulum sp. TS8]
MIAYIIRRLLLIIPTFFAIIAINFFIIQLAPGGPVDQYIAAQSGLAATSVMQERLAASGSEVNQARDISAQEASGYRGAGGLTKEEIAEIEKRFGFDKPIGERFWEMLKNYLQFDFGESLFRGKGVFELIVERLPVSISLGLWSLLIVYAISVPLGIRKAITNGSQFDGWTTTVILAASAIPAFLFAVLLVILFAGGSFFDWFPLRGLTSNNWESLSVWGKITDYFWHMTLPILATVIGSFAGLTMLTKNLFLDEINRQYVITARAKGLTENAILYKHVFRNAMLLIVSGFPAAIIGVFFGSSLIIEIIFSLDGLGLLFYETTVQRDYPVIFATLYVFTLVGLILNILSDVMYMIIDPRIDFESR